MVTALKEYFGWAKGNWGIADFLGQCFEAEIPSWIRDACITLKAICDPPPAPVAAPPVPPAPPVSPAPPAPPAPPVPLAGNGGQTGLGPAA